MMPHSFDRTWKSNLKELLAEITGCDVIPYGYCNFGREAQPDAISAIVEGPEVAPSLVPTLDPSVEEKAYEYLERIRARLPEGFVAYVGTTRWLAPLVDKRETDFTASSPDAEAKPSSGSQPVGDYQSVINNFVAGGAFKRVTRKMQPRLGIELAIGPGSSQLDIPRLAKTVSLDDGLTTEDIVDKLHSLDERFGINILHAATDTLSFELLARASNPVELAEEIFEFCPDLQCTETVEQYAKKLQGEKGHVELWWD